MEMIMKQMRSRISWEKKNHSFQGCCRVLESVTPAGGLKFNRNYNRKSTVGGEVK